MIREQFVRNLGVMSEAEVAKLQDAAIAVAGCGCIGGFSAELLARMGIGRLKLADPDVFDVSNINRQCAAYHDTVGRLKVEALRDHLLRINPVLQLDLYPEGITEANVDTFVRDADYVIDAIDYFAFHQSVALHRAARRFGKPVITAAALGFGTSVLMFAPDGMTLEQYVGIPEDTPLDRLQDAVFPPSGYSAQLPSYATEDKLREWLGNRTIPTISVGQALGPGALVSRLVLHLLGRRPPVPVPESFQLQFEA